MRAWFLKITSVQTSIYVFVCVHPLGKYLVVWCVVIWTPCDRLNKSYSFYMPAIVIISDERDLRMKACHRNQPNKSKLSLYKLLFSPFKWLYTSNKTEYFSYKGRCGGCERTHIEVFKTRADLGYK